jgi:HD-GYP domain-containing protein (c-di-GMP phosphodiesterase class II)
MGRPTHRYSLLSQKLDRAAFVAYFLGAVVPLAALVWVTHRFLLPELPDGPATYRALGVVLSIGILSLGSFLLLRGITRQSLARLDDHNRRLEHLLEASRAVADAPYAAEVCRHAAESARSLLDLRAALVVSRNAKEPEELQLEGSAGADAQELFEALGESLAELLERAEGRSLVVGAGRVAGGVAELAAAPLVEGGAPAGAVVAVRLPGEPRFAEGEASSLSTLATLVSVARHNADLRDSQRNFFAHVTEILVTALDAHMHLQQGHARRVAHFAVLVGRELGFEGERLERLHFAGLLHDIGMLKIRNTSTGGKAAYRQHPLLGYRMLKPIRLWEELAPLVLHHHEWFDGQGYPEGLSGEAIPLESRILGVAEAFDSMTSRKSYREPLGFEDALQEVRASAGTQFDPTVARRFVELSERGVIRLIQEG